MKKLMKNYANMEMTVEAMYDSCKTGGMTKCSCNYPSCYCQWIGNTYTSQTVADKNYGQNRYAYEHASW